MYVEDVGCDFPELRRRRFLIVNNTLNILLYGVAFVVNCSNLFIYFQSAGGASGDENFFFFTKYDIVSLLLIYQKLQFSWHQFISSFFRTTKIAFL